GQRAGAGADDPRRRGRGHDPLRAVPALRGRHRRERPVAGPRGAGWAPTRTHHRANGTCPGAGGRPVSEPSGHRAAVVAIGAPATIRSRAPPTPPPTSGTTQNNHSCCTAQRGANRATPVLRAGLTEVLVTGM